MNFDRLKRLKRMFSGPTTDDKISAMQTKVDELTEKRDQIYTDTDGLAKKETELLEEGKASTSPIARRRIAAQISQLRKDLGRSNASIAIFNGQINILSTDIHNMKLLEASNLAQLPDAQKVTQNAVRAEEMIEALSSNAELVDALSATNDILTSDEELAILREFEQDDEAPEVEVNEEKEQEDAEAKRQEHCDAKLTSLDQRLGRADD